MDSNLIANLLSLTLFAVSLVIVVRSFYRYARFPNRRLFILGLSMTIIALTALAGFAGDNITAISLNVDWFNYIGQTVSFLFILLSLWGNSDRYLRRLTRWHIIISSLLLILLLLAPLLPSDFPDPSVTKSLLSGSRGAISLIICITYITSFMRKENHFNLLMSGAFILISLGYFIIIPKYFQPNATLDHVGDILRITGFLTFLVAILIGEPARAPDEDTVRSARALLVQRQALNRRPLS
ncbi:MAG: hypothetical protein ABI456_25630 [Ktedonobacteraceae bacterium]